MYLMHRMNIEHEKEFKMLREENLATIGWSALHSKEYEKKHYGERVIQSAKSLNQKEFGQFMINVKKKEKDLHWITKNRSYFLYRFLNLKVDNILIIPSNRELTICRVKDEPRIYSTTENTHIGFVVPIKILHDHVSRYDYVSNSLSAKLKYRGTNLVLSDENGLCNEIDELIKLISNEKPIYDFGETKEKIVDIIADYIYEKIDSIKFENLIREYLNSLGADETKIPGKRSQKNRNSDRIADIDVKASFKGLGICIYVQAKKYNRNTVTSIKVLEQLKCYEHELDSEFGYLQPVKWLITTGTVTQEFIDEAQENDIRVISGSEFSEILFESGFSFDSKIFK